MGDFPGSPIWLGFCASTAEGMGSISGQGTKILHAGQVGQKKTKNELNFFFKKTKKERLGETLEI